jgi:hypothetical protein
VPLCKLFDSRTPCKTSLCSKMIVDGWEIARLMSFPTCRKIYFSWAASAYVAQFNSWLLLSTTNARANSKIIVSFNTLCLW